MDPEFVVDTAAVTDQPATVTFPIRREWSAGALGDYDLEPADEPGMLDVEVSRHGAGYLARGHVRACFSTTCVRCLERTVVEVNVRFDALYQPGAPQVSQEGAGKGDDDEEDITFGDEPDVERFQGSTIAFDAYVRDTILLEIPMNPRCPVPCTPPVAGHDKAS